MRSASAATRPIVLEPIRRTRGRAARFIHEMGHVTGNPTAEIGNKLRSLAERGEFAESLQVVLGAACNFFGCAGAGLMLIDDERALQFIAATDARSESLERTQADCGEGPCVDSVVLDRVVHTSDLRREERWPQLRDSLGDPTIAAVLGAPVRLEIGAVGSLDVYLDQRHDWRDPDERALGTHADLCANVLEIALRAAESSDLASQLQHALHNRVHIERAVGVLMGTDHLDAVAAYDQLRSAARDRGLRVASVADRILSGDWPLE